MNESVRRCKAVELAPSSGDKKNDMIRDNRNVWQRAFAMNGG